MQHKEDTLRGSDEEKVSSHFEAQSLKLNLESKLILIFFLLRQFDNYGSFSEGIPDTGGGGGGALTVGRSGDPPDMVVRGWELSGEAVGWNQRHWKKKKRDSR